MSASRAPPPQPAERGLLRQRPRRTRPVAAGGLHRPAGPGGPGHRGLRRHRLRRQRRRPPHVGPPAPAAARAHGCRAADRRGQQPRAPAPAGRVHPRADRPHARLWAELPRGRVLSRYWSPPSCALDLDSPVEDRSGASSGPRTLRRWPIDSGRSSPRRRPGCSATASCASWACHVARSAITSAWGVGQCARPRSSARRPDHCPPSRRCGWEFSMAVPRPWSGRSAQPAYVG